MSTSTAMTRLDGFIGERGGRIITLGLLALAVAAFAVLPSVPQAAAWVAGKSGVLYLTVLTIQAAFLAAVLTIWTLMKTRASRYVERLAESASFGAFISAFEIRLVIGCVSVFVTAIVTVADWKLTADHGVESLVVVAWAYLALASLVLLIDSLLTARRLL